MLQDILGRFLTSNEWRSWSRSEEGTELLTMSATAPLTEEPPRVEPEAPKKAPQPPPQSQLQWDGWD